VLNRIPAINNVVAIAKFISEGTDNSYIEAETQSTSKLAKEYRNVKQQERIICVLGHALQLLSVINLALIFYNKLKPNTTTADSFSMWTKGYLYCSSYNITKHLIDDPLKRNAFESLGREFQATSLKNPNIHMKREFLRIHTDVISVIFLNIMAYTGYPIDIIAKHVFDTKS
jgi:hypothetical protein